MHLSKIQSMWHRVMSLIDKTVYLQQQHWTYCWNNIICGTSYFDEIFWRLPGSDTELHREPFYKKERKLKSELGTLIPRKLLILFWILKTMRQPIWFVLLTSLDTDRELSAASDKCLLRVTWCWTPGYDQKQSKLISSNSVYVFVGELQRASRKARVRQHDRS